MAVLGDPGRGTPRRDTLDRPPLNLGSPLPPLQPGPLLLQDMSPRCGHIKSQPRVPSLPSGAVGTRGPGYPSMSSQWDLGVPAPDLSPAPKATGTFPQGWQPPLGPGPPRPPVPILRGPGPGQLAAGPCRPLTRPLCSTPLQSSTRKKVTRSLAHPAPAPAAPQPGPSARPASSPPGSSGPGAVQPPHCPLSLLTAPLLRAHRPTRINPSFLSVPVGPWALSRHVLVKSPPYQHRGPDPACLCLSLSPSDSSSVSVSPCPCLCLSFSPTLSLSPSASPPRGRKLWADLEPLPRWGRRLWGPRVPGRVERRGAAHPGTVRGGLPATSPARL